MLTYCSGQLAIPCAPALIDMEAYFAKSIQLNSEMRNMIQNFKVANSLMDNCGDLDLFGEHRCDTVCTTVTHSTTESITTSASESTKFTSALSRDSTSADPQPMPEPSTPERNELTQTGAEDERTTNSIGVVVPPKKDEIPKKDAVAYTPIENRTTIYICIGAGVLLIVVMIAIGLICR